MKLTNFFASEESIKQFNDKVVNEYGYQARGAIHRTLMELFNKGKIKIKKEDIIWSK